MSEEAKWYVCHTYPGYENKVATNLETIVENRKPRIGFRKSLSPPRPLPRSRTEKNARWNAKFSPATCW